MDARGRASSAFGFGLMRLCWDKQRPTDAGPSKLTTINMTEFRQLWADAQMLDELLPPKRIVEIFQNERARQHSHALNHAYCWPCLHRRLCCIVHGTASPPDFRCGASTARRSESASASRWR